MRTRLTDAVCGQRPPKTGRIEIWDTVLPGLCLRIYPSVARTFSLMPRARFSAGGRRRRQRRISLWPRYPLLTLAEARKQARELTMEWAAGADLPEPRTPGLSTAEVVKFWIEMIRRTPGRASGPPTTSAARWRLGATGRSGSSGAAPFRR